MLAEYMICRECLGCSEGYKKFFEDFGSREKQYDIEDLYYCDACVEKSRKKREKRENGQTKADNCIYQR